MLRARINASVILSRAPLVSEMWPTAAFVLLANTKAVPLPIGATLPGCYFTFAKGRMKIKNWVETN